jgi:hypothetical protein
MQAFNAQARVSCRRLPRAVLKAVCTAETSSPRCSCGFRQLFCLTKPSLLSPAPRQLGEDLGVRHWCSRLPLARRLRKTASRCPGANRDRQVVDVFVRRVDVCVGAGNRNRKCRRSEHHPGSVSSRCQALPPSSALQIKFHSRSAKPHMTQASHALGQALRIRHTDMNNVHNAFLAP